MNKFELYKKDFLENLSKEQKELLEKLCYYSKCTCDFLFRNENELFFLHDSLEKPLLERKALIKQCEEEVNQSLPESEFIQKLTYFKMKHFARILAKDIYEKHHLTELMQEYSYLADATLEVAFKRAYKEAEKRYGTPLNEDGKPIGASVIALGKLGGLELNYYSDIDIMYIYEEEGKTERGFSTKEFFSFMFTKLTQLLSRKNIEGQTWIVDLDLRPNGKSGFIAYPLQALEVYYWTTGRTWERHMLIKARHSAGDEKTSNAFLDIVRPFVYRKTISKEELKEIVEMKKLIEQEAKKVSKDSIDIKKCDGGIREIEFTAQILQLIYGGKIKELQERSTYKAIEKLARFEILSKDEKEKLQNAYIFLRKLEHIIQVENCTQTQTFRLSKAKEYAQKLGYSSEEEFLDEFTKHRENVKQIFSSLQIGEAKELTPIQKYIFTKHYEEEAKNYIAELGCKKPDWALERFKEIFLSKEFVYLDQSLKESLFEFIPELEKQLKEFNDKDDFLLNLTNILVKGKLLSVFASAIKQNKKFAEFILNIAKMSDYISKLMSKDPKLLDFVFNSLDKSLETKEDFERELQNIKAEDFVERLNILKNLVEITSSVEYLSKIDKKDSLSRLKKLNETLSNLADFILEKLYSRYESKGLAIFALGKLGSREMNIGSDLDLIFAFDTPENKEKFYSIPVKITKDLTRYTKEGILYQIDLRLRPYGKAGELAPTVSFYKNYFDNVARSWERLAWTKARFITGDESTKIQMEKTIEEFLFSKPVDKKFVEEVLEMRFRLEGFTNEKLDEIDIKLGHGGLADVEFALQLYKLKHKIKESSVLSVLEKINSPILNDYVFLREVETRLRMIKGTGISRISKKDSSFYRVATSFKKTPQELWNEILQVRKRLREFFLITTKKVI